MESYSYQNCQINNFEQIRGSLTKNDQTNFKVSKEATLVMVFSVTNSEDEDKTGFFSSEFNEPAFPDQCSYLFGEKTQ